MKIKDVDISVGDKVLINDRWIYEIVDIRGGDRALCYEYEGINNEGRGSFIPETEISGVI